MTEKIVSFLFLVVKKNLRASFVQPSLLNHKGTKHNVCYYVFCKKKDFIGHRIIYQVIMRLKDSVLRASLVFFVVKKEFRSIPWPTLRYLPQSAQRKHKGHYFIFSKKTGLHWSHFSTLDT